MKLCIVDSGGGGGGGGEIIQQLKQWHIASEERWKFFNRRKIHFSIKKMHYREPGHYGKKKREAYVKCENCVGLMKLSTGGMGNLHNDKEIRHGSYSTRKGDHLPSNWTDVTDGPQYPPPS